MDEFLGEIYIEIFKQWILMKKRTDLDINWLEDKNSIEIVNKYSRSHVNFYNMNIIEFSVENIAKKEIEFYLHFQIKNIKHAIDLFNEMLEVINKLTHNSALKVLLCCSGGLTTGYFAERINQIVKLLNQDIEVAASSYNNLYKASNDYDMIMLAPQISYMNAKVREILKDKIVVNIPPAVFAKYDVKRILAIIDAERDYRTINLKGKQKPLKSKKIKPSGVKTLCLTLIRNSNRVHVCYRVYDEVNNILENNEIIKQTLSIRDYYDVIDSMLSKYPDIKVIGLSTPGIITDDRIISMSINGLEEILIERDFTSKYSQKFVCCNDANSIALGCYSLMDDCSSLSFVFQPVSSHSGAGHIVNDHLISGTHHVAGEIQYLPLSYSKDVIELHQTPEGAIEAMAKTIVSIICFLDPQVIVVYCFLLTDVEELKKEVAKYIPEVYIPKIILADYLQEYMLLGTLLICHQDD